MRAMIRWLVMLFAVSLWSCPVSAIDEFGELEMDGNAVQELADYKDWDTLYANPNEALLFTGINDDPSPWSIFEGGRKDIQDISMWRHKDGSVPDKDDITNAYAAAYICNTGEPDFHEDCNDGETIVFFGADRYSNTGDAFLGFWFFKDYVYAREDGTFHGEHQPGDVLVLVNFPQASNASPEIRAVVWDPLCLKAEKDAVGDFPGTPGTNCAARNLRLLYDGVVCDDPGSVSDYACAITNTEERFPNDSNSWSPGTVFAPWKYEAKSPDPACSADPDCFPYESFFEGGLNLTVLVGGGLNACFASFLVETRSSSSFTATLKDFEVDEFPLCAVEISKVCGPGYYDAGQQQIVIPFEVTLENTGAADVASIAVEDDFCGGAWASLGTITDLASGDSDSLVGECLIDPATYAGGIVNGARADAGEVEVVPGECDSVVDGECFANCPVDLSPAIAVSKRCEAGLVMHEGRVVVEVTFSGVVENTSDDPHCLPTGFCAFPADLACAGDGDCEAAPTPLVDVTVTDDKAGVVLSGATLEPGATAGFGGAYFPDSLADEWVCAADVSFSDTVEAEGWSIDGIRAYDTADATCAPCVDCTDPPAEP